MRSNWARWSAIAAAGAATGACALTPGVAAKPAAKCSGGDLAGAIIDVQGAAGSRFGRLILVNKSSRACPTKGFIRGQLIAANGARLPTTIVRSRGTPVPAVTIRPGAAGALAVRWNVVPSDSRPCPIARSLRVTPPESRSGLNVYFPQTVCRGRIDVGPITDAATV